MFGFLLRCVRLLQRKFLQPFYFFLHKVILGLMNYGIGGDANGEAFVLKQLEKYRKKQGYKLTIFDVGANVGQYAQLVNESITDRLLYSFEPSKSTFTQLKNQNKKLKDFFPYNIGFSDKKDVQFLYRIDNKDSDPTYACASLYSDNIRNFVGDTLQEESIQLDTVDNFCKQHKIQHIDLLKIDVEGNEFKVLQGCQELLSRSSIDIIQIELNRCSISSRVFLRDYWDLLEKDFAVFRILGNHHGLYRIKKYDIYLENFAYINYLFIRKTSDFYSFIS